MIVTQTLKQRIYAGEVTHGCWINLGSTFSAEIVARAGFDWVLIDLEHGANDVELAVRILQVVGGLPSTPIIRTDTLSRPLIQRILDGGANGIMFPRIEQPADAELAVQTMYYPPRGVRGMARQVRATGFGRNADDYLNNLEKSLVNIIQIETVDALKNVDKIAAIPGVDVLFVGPTDLSLAMGILGQLQHENYQKAIRDVATAAKKHGKVAGVLLTDPSEYEMYYKLGYRFLNSGADTAFVARSANDMVKKLKEYESSMKK
jgi:2-keto-3-deoxy-L-rhamnonate aldolase RhmA